MPALVFTVKMDRQKIAKHGHLLMRGETVVEMSIPVEPKDM